MSSPLHFRCSKCGSINRIPGERVAEGPACGRCHTPIDRSAHPADVDDEALERLIQSSPVPVLADFWAEWCGPCRMVAPHLVELARRHAGRLIVVKVDTDRHQRVAQGLRVQSIPTMVVWKGGQIANKQIGAVMGPQLEAVVAPYL
ncbi:MAG TPA: thioredoxin [Nannocystaceae bacterium]|nr:thioredoxin [Nannocystaceae bacterium]